MVRVAWGIRRNVLAFHHAVHRLPYNANTFHLSTNNQHPNTRRKDEPTGAIGKRAVRGTILV